MHLSDTRAHRDNQIFFWKVDNEFRKKHTNQKEIKDIRYGKRMWRRVVDPGKWEQGFDAKTCVREDYGAVQLALGDKF